MTTMKRAWLYVRRNKKRTILLFLLFTVLITISMLGLALNMASKNTVKELRGSIGGYFTLEVGADGTGKTNEALLNQIKRLDHINKYNGIDMYFLRAEELNLLPGLYDGTGTTDEFTSKMFGCTDTSLHERFLSSSFQLIAGRHIIESDEHKAIISKEVAQLSGLSVGDTFTVRTKDDLRSWNSEAGYFETKLEIFGIYQATRSEPVRPGTPEYQLQENIVFTDISTSKQLYQVKFPDRSPEEYQYSSGFMLFVDDPVNIPAVVADLKQQSFADWDSFVISENSAAYQQAAAPIQKAETISFFLLLVILVISIGILALILLMWTRDRMTEIGILISLGISPMGIFEQILLENYITAAAAFLVSIVLSILLSSSVGRLVGTLATQIHVGAGQMLIVLICTTAVILITVFLASIFIMRKNPKNILADLS
ncbi:MAG: ABC transporter permease [Agathobaculum desmolans]|uniref:ABC transporter permease n=1 Tax=Agathobaculum desmolans TaxID=39484 RepID=UPI003994D2B4